MSGCEHTPSGTFAEDLEHWIDQWTDPRQRKTFVMKARVLWTHQPLHAIGLFRLSSWCRRHHIPMLPEMLRRLNIVLYGLDIVSSIPIGGGLYLPHTVGTVIMAERIGRNVTIVSNVTIGMRHTGVFPTIGDDVYIGAGARVLGPITIGGGAVIGANAVVLTDIPPGATAVGVPAKIIRKSEQERQDAMPEARAEH